MAEIRVTTRCAGCPGTINWTLIDRARTGAPEVLPEGDVLTADAGRETFCPACTEAVRGFLEQRKAAASAAPNAPKKPGPKPKEPPAAKVA